MDTIPLALICSFGGAALRAVVGIIKAWGDRTFEYIDWRKLAAQVPICFLFGLLSMLLLRAIPFIKIDWDFIAAVAVIAGYAGPDLTDKAGSKVGIDSSSISAPMIGQPQQSSQVSPRQQKALDHIKANGSISNDKYKEINKVSDRTAVRDMQDLKGKGRVKAQGKGRNVKYVLS